MKGISSADKYYDLWVLLADTKEAILKSRQRELIRYNITATQAAILFIIQAIGDQATPSEISRQIFRKPSTVTEILNRMEKQGLVKKVKDLNRKNLVRVALTDKGREAYHLSSHRKSIRKIMSSLSPENRQQLRSFLQTLREEALKYGIQSGIP